MSHRQQAKTIATAPCLEQEIDYFAGAEQPRPLHDGRYLPQLLYGIERANRGRIVTGYYQNRKSPVKFRYRDDHVATILTRRIYLGDDSHRVEKAQHRGEIVIA